MQEKLFYLKQNVMSEPLINNWYVWSHLISPATAAMLVSNRHLKIMRSYINSPKIHEEAVKNISLKGGSFLDAENQDRVLDVSKLLNHIENECGFQLDFAKDIKKLSDLLRNNSLISGESLHNIYNNIPDALKGYVELIYDVNNNLSFRFFEALLYKSKYYITNHQTVLLSETFKDERPFVLSTPRFPNNDSLLIKKPFSDSFYDNLFSARFNPKNLEEINAIHGDIKEDVDRKSFLNLFTDIAPKRDSKLIDSSLIEIKYFGHACLLIQTKKTNILVDPLISYCKHQPNSINRYTYTDLPDEIEYVAITHAHQDHFVFETLLQLRHKIKNIIVPRNVPGALQDPSLTLMLKNLGFKNIIQIDEMDELEIPGGKIIGIPFMGEHGDLNIHSKIAYVFLINSRAILCAVDSNNIQSQLYMHLNKFISPIDVAFIGMECEGAPLSWIYGSILLQPLSREANESRRLNSSNSDAAFDMIKKLKCNNVYIYAMGMEPWLSFISSIYYNQQSIPIIESNKLINLCSSHGIPAKRLFGKDIIIL